MIDFRYHLVSLVSVFLALAVGIVLGAGPLKEPIATSLTKDVASLRQQKDDLHASLLTANAGLAERDDFTTGVTASLVADQLTGRTIAIVILPGVAGNEVQPLIDAITAAGGRVSARVTINGDWVSPSHAAQREEVAAGLGGGLPTATATSDGAGGSSTGGTDARLADLLANALISTAVGASARAGTASSAVIDAFQSANLIDVKGKITGFAGAALVLAPPNPVASDKVVPTPAGTPQQQYVTLATALSTTGGGVVVTGPASGATGGGLLAAIRDDSTAKTAVSTVDTGSTPMGVITAVLALREQLAGGSGAYGFGKGASQVMPALGVLAATGK